MIKVCYSELDGPKGLSLRLEAAGHAVLPRLRKRLNRWSSSIRVGERSFTGRLCLP